MQDTEISCAIEKGWASGDNRKLSNTVLRAAYNEWAVVQQERLRLQSDEAFRISCSRYVRLLGEQLGHLRMNNCEHRPENAGQEWIFSRRPGDNAKKFNAETVPRVLTGVA